MLAACAQPVSRQQVTTPAGGDGDDAPSQDGDSDGDDDPPDDDDGPGENDDDDGEPAGDGDGPPGDGDGDGDGDDGAWGSPDGAVAEEDAGDSDGWSSTDDGGVGDDPSADPGHDGGTSPDGCRTLANNTNSGAFGTTAAVCFILQTQPATSWEAYFVDGRTITINGAVVSQGKMPFPGTPPYTVEFSAGLYDYASWAYW
jgi:hypothetical protein